MNCKINFQAAKYGHSRRVLSAENMLLHIHACRNSSQRALGMLPKERGAASAESL